MQCPNCRITIVKKKAGKFLCRKCGWFEKVGREWHSCGEPETVSPVAPQSRDIAGKYTKRSPEPKIKKILGGLVTITDGYTKRSPKLKTRNILGGLVTITEIDK